MKTKIQYLAVICSLFLLAACYEDKGNYNYTPISDVVISNIKIIDTAYVGQQYIVQPALSYPHGPIKNIAYEWRISGKVVSQEKDLNIKMTLSPSTVYADYAVIDKDSGLKSLYTFKIYITSEFLTGWLLLCDMGTYSRLDYMQDNGNFHEDIYYDINGEHLSGKPLMIREHFRPWKTDIGQLLVVSQENPGPVELNGSNFNRVVHTRDEFAGSAPADFMPMSADYVQGCDYVVSNHKLYSRLLLNKTGAEFQEGSYASTPFYGDYSLSSWSARGNWLAEYVVYFDEKSKSFMEAREGELNFFDYVNDPEKKFNPLNMNSTLLAGAMTANKSPEDNYLVVMRNASNQINLYRFAFNNSTKKYKSLAAATFPKPELINDNTHFAICRKRPYMYFNVGTVLYYYNYEVNTEPVELCDLKRPIANMAINPVTSETLGVTIESENNASLCDFLVLDVSIAGNGKVVTEKKSVTRNVVHILYKIGNKNSVNN